MRGKTIMIVGATHLMKQRKAANPSPQRPLDRPWDEEDIQDWLKSHPGLTREKLLAEIEYFGGAVVASVSRTSTNPLKEVDKA
jgi:hypothetical protein